MTYSRILYLSSTAGLVGTLCTALANKWTSHLTVNAQPQRFQPGEFTAQATARPQPPPRPPRTPCPPRPPIHTPIGRPPLSPSQSCPPRFRPARAVDTAPKMPRRSREKLKAVRKLVRYDPYEPIISSGGEIGHKVWSDRPESEDPFKARYKSIIAPDMDETCHHGFPFGPDEKEEEMSKISFESIDEIHSILGDTMDQQSQACSVDETSTLAGIRERLGGVSEFKPLAKPAAACPDLDKAFAKRAVCSDLDKTPENSPAVIEETQRRPVPVDKTCPVSDSSSDCSSLRSPVKSGVRSPVKSTVHRRRREGEAPPVFPPKFGSRKILEFKDFVVCYDNLTRTVCWSLEYFPSKSVDRMRWFPPEDAEEERVRADFRSTECDYKAVEDRFKKQHAAEIEYHVNRAKEDIREACVFSNVFAQAVEGRPHDTRSLWDELYDYVADLSKYTKNFYVLTGALYMPQQTEDCTFGVKYEQIGENRVAVPTHFYKVILCRNWDMKWRLECYKFENKFHEDMDLTKYLVPRHDLEKDTGFLIFKKLPDDLISDQREIPECIKQGLKA